ncbi:NADH dehydrogenase subunit 6 (mitochondrion) [Daphnia carinata]|uniref:NADH-ubiquinone oxidoreductase chain 6 n=1 Tax=Daphnia carinata TaxID=120202 RepID=A0A0N7CDR0_9CRUS|nr:NADH dehydrogenase subunit 6 [Daphnia carinata]AKL90615.1 NADH dehydrogenase subunit 6 [Daphnia carinata]
MLSAIMIMLASIFPSLTHPLSMGLAILILTIFMAATLGMLSTNFWLSYILILVLLGGLLVIFIYISLLASNELFSKKNILKMLFGSIMMLFFTLFYSNLFFWTTKSEGVLSVKSNNNEGLMWLNSLYSLDLGGVTVFLVFYLLLTLIVVVNITKSDSSSLRAH